MAFHTVGWPCELVDARRARQATDLSSFSGRWQAMVDCGSVPARWMQGSGRRWRPWLLADAGRRGMPLHYRSNVGAPQVSVPFRTAPLLTAGQSSWQHAKARARGRTANRLPRLNERDVRSHAARQYASDGGSCQAGLAQPPRTSA